MPDHSIGTAPGGQIPVSPNNPCPFLRALVANGYVGGHVVPLSKLSEMIGAASGETGSAKKKVGLENWMVAVIANGLGPLGVLRSVTSASLKSGPCSSSGGCPSGSPHGCRSRPRAEHHLNSGVPGTKASNAAQNCER